MAPILVHITPVWSLLRMAAKASSCVPFSEEANLGGGILCNLSNPNFNFLFQNSRLTPFGIRPLRRVRFRNPEAS